MTRDERAPGKDALVDETKPRKPYAAPKLVKYGSVRSLTQASTSGSSEGSAGSGVMKPSDRAMKQDIVRIGDHPLGMGLYLFQYKPEFREAHGMCRQLGVMVDEVAVVAPQAVRFSATGPAVVDYGLLGIRPFPG